MHVPASAVTLARSLLSLSRSRSSGVLSVRSDTAECRFAIDGGQVRGAVSNWPQPSLGDVLVRTAGCDAETLAAAGDEFHPPAGAWVVQRGLATRRAVIDALHEQLRSQVCSVFRWPRHDLTFVEGPAEVGVYWVPDPPATESLVLDGMRAAVSHQVDDAHTHIVPRSQLTAWGHSLLQHGATDESERALLNALQPGAAIRELITAAHSCERAHRTWSALRVFGALTAPTRVRYALLLRKRAELRRRANAHELLDLDPTSHVHKDAPRRALRRLALHLHPDRLGPDAPESARVLSTEVMRALTRAAASLS